MCCLWQISVHFVFTVCFFFFWERDTQRGLISSDWNTGWVASCFFPCRTEETEVSLGNTRYRTLGMTKPPGCCWPCCHLLSSPHISTGQRKCIFQPLLLTSAPALASHPPLFISGKFEGPFPGTILFIVWFITRQRHNSGEPGKMLVFFYHFRNQLRK